MRYMDIQKIEVYFVLSRILSGISILFSGVFSYFFHFFLRLLNRHAIAFPCNFFLIRSLHNVHFFLLKFISSFTPSFIYVMYSFPIREIIPSKQTMFTLNFVYFILDVIFRMLSIYLGSV